MDLGLTDRVYVLTGASRGLGFATARCLVADGARVVLSARTPERVAAAVDRLGGPDHAIGLVADLADAQHSGAAGRRPPVSTSAGSTGRWSRSAGRPGHRRRGQRRRSGGSPSRRSSSVRSGRPGRSPPR